jgi:hypothetical protein
MIVIFAGPTIRRDMDDSGLVADWRPPAVHGDLLRAMREPVEAVGLIDGCFGTTRAILHKEILFALRQQIRVYGAASMGALRAAELKRYGMRGVGTIFEGFASGELEDDDEVALIHGDASVNYLALSEPMVNIRSTLRAATAQGVVTRATADKLISNAKAAFFPDRSYTTLLAAGARLDVPASEVSALTDWLPTGRIDVKLSDARAMLKVMAREAAQESPQKTNFPFEDTSVWLELVRDALHRSVDRKDFHGQVLAILARRDESYESYRRAGLARVLAHDVARRSDLISDPDVLVRAAIRLRERHGLSETADVENWIRANDLSRADFVRMIEVEAAVAELEQTYSESVDLEVLDHLRVLGKYSGIRDARDFRAS